MVIKNNELVFAISKEGAIIPTKENENAGYDIYACFDEKYIIIKPNETRMIPTGLHTAFSEDYVGVLKERGSTGSRGIALRAGIIDSGFRAEIFVALTNTTDKLLFISKLPEKETAIDYFKNVFDEWYIINNVSNYIVYDYKKAIAQMLLLPVPKMETRIFTLEDLRNIGSKRGDGALGSSGK